MNEPWGLSGPQFLGVFVAGMIVALVITMLLRRAVGARSQPDVTEPLTVDEVAYLAGGRRRVVESAIGWLIHHQWVRAQRGAKLSPVSAREDADPTDLQRAAVEEIERTPGVTMPRVRAKLVSHPAVGRARASLVRRRLVVGGGFGLLALTALPVLAVEVVGIVRFVNGVQLGRPVGFLLLLLLVGIVAVVLTLRGATPWRTSAGQEIHRVATGKGENTYGARLPVLTGTVGAVALGGLVAFPNQAIASSFQSSSSGSGGGSGSSCAGAGCGGGGGCGG